MKVMSSLSPDFARSACWPRCSDNSSSVWNQAEQRKQWWAGLKSDMGGGWLTIPPTSIFVECRITCSTKLRVDESSAVVGSTLGWFAEKNPRSCNGYFQT